MIIFVGKDFKTESTRAIKNCVAERFNQFLTYSYDFYSYFRSMVPQDKIRVHEKAVYGGNNLDIPKKELDKLMKIIKEEAVSEVAIPELDQRLLELSESGYALDEVVLMINNVPDIPTLRKIQETVAIAKDNLTIIIKDKDIEKEAKSIEGVNKVILIDESSEKVKEDIFKYSEELKKKKYLI